MMLDKIPYVVDDSDMPLYSYYPFYHPYRLMMDSFHSSGNSSLFIIELICLWISEQVVLPLALINSSGIRSMPGDLCHFSF